MCMFFLDFYDLCKAMCEFMKKHWKGYILYNVIVGAVGVVIMFRESICNWFSSKFRKEEIEP